jgi:hypothetical protein
MFRKIVIGILVILAGGVVLGGVGYLGYWAGAAQGGNVSPAIGWGMPHMFARGGRYFMTPMLGFGFLRCLMPLIGLGLLALVVRWMVGPRHWGWRHNPEAGHFPPFFEEWHRRAHAAEKGEAQAPVDSESPRP